MTLFDAFGRRIPSPGMRVHPDWARGYFETLQPPIDYQEIYKRSVRHLGLTALPFTSEQFKEKCEQLIEALKQNESVANVVKGVHVPFICPPLSPDTRRIDDLDKLVQAARASFKEQHPKGELRDQAQITQFPSDFGIAEHSRYERLEAARGNGVVVGWYFPCVIGFDLDSQRRQTSELPEAFTLAGGAEVAAALVGSPGLLLNKGKYPHIQCLSALVDPDKRFFISFDPYGGDMIFYHRNNKMTPELTQVSEQFAGGLTVFEICK